MINEGSVGGNDERGAGKKQLAQKLGAQEVGTIEEGLGFGWHRWYK